MLEWNLGQWYFTVQCKFCDADIAFQNDPSGGCLLFRVLSDETRLAIACPDCGREANYSSSEVTSVRAH